MTHPTPNELVLVSIVVLTYNSGAMLQETLDSLTQQSYPSLEVIICDDGSADDTQTLVSAWIARHEHLFRRVVFLQSNINEGICRNLAKGYAAARGIWMKPIAGDDILMPGAISKYVAAADGSTHAAIFSKVVTFSNKRSRSADEKYLLPRLTEALFIREPPHILLKKLLISNFLPAPGAILRRATYEAVGGVDLSFKHLDDWPLWINVLKRGATIGMIDDTLVSYRIDSSLTTQRKMATEINRDYLLDLIHFYEKYQKKHLSALHRLDRSIWIFRWRLAVHPLKYSLLLYKLTRVLHIVSPLIWLNFYRSK